MLILYAVLKTDFLENDSLDVGLDCSLKKDPVESRVLFCFFECIGLNDTFVSFKVLYVF